MSGEDWRDQAACRGVDVDVFFPGKGDVSVTFEARRICAGCPVRVDCLHANLHERYGIWGGLSETERREYRRRRLRPVS